MLNLVIAKTTEGLYSSAHQTTHEIIETFSGKSDCTTWCTWSCKIASYLFPIIQPCQAITGCNNVHEMAAHIIMDPPPYLAIGSRYWGLKASLASSKHKINPDVGNIVKVDLSEHIFFHCWGVQFFGGFFFSAHFFHQVLHPHALAFDTKVVWMVAKLRK